MSGVFGGRFWHKGGSLPHHPDVSDESKLYSERSTKENCGHLPGAHTSPVWVDDREHLRFDPMLSSM